MWIKNFTIHSKKIETVPVMRKLLILLFMLCLFVGNSMASDSQGSALPATANTSVKLTLKQRVKAKIASKASKMSQNHYEKRMERYEQKMERYQSEGKGREPKKPQGSGLIMFLIGAVLLVISWSIYEAGKLSAYGWVPILGFIFVLASFLKLVME
jgi:hypothetical protein